MTLLDMQRILSRILTDRDFQRDFLAGADLAEAGYQISARELSSLRSLHWTRVNEYAHGLAHGRLEKALKPLPLTTVLLEHRLHDHLARYCREYPPVPVAGGVVVAEAGRMCDFAATLFAEGSLRPAWGVAIMAYERIRMELAYEVGPAESALAVAALNKRYAGTGADVGALVPVAGSHVRVEAFGYPLDELVVELEEGRRPDDEIPPIDPPLLLLFHKLPGLHQVHSFRVNPATAALVAACDGVRTVDQVVARFAGAAGDPGGVARERVLGGLEMLRAAGIIAYRKDG